MYGTPWAGSTCLPLSEPKAQTLLVLSLVSRGGRMPSIQSVGPVLLGLVPGMSDAMMFNHSSMQTNPVPVGVAFTGPPPGHPPELPGFPFP